jgi:predicted nucleic acid-binding protein
MPLLFAHETRAVHVGVSSSRSRTPKAHATAPPRTLLFSRERARVEARLEAKGRMLDRADGEIAATAATKRLTLVTANVRDFRQPSTTDDQGRRAIR